MTRRLEPQDLYAIKLVEDPQITPDGERIAYLVAEIDRESYEYHRSIWVADVASTELHRYTAGNNDRSPRWSPDGRSLAFVRGPAGEVKPKMTTSAPRSVPRANHCFRRMMRSFPKDGSPHALIRLHRCVA